MHRVVTRSQWVISSVLGFLSGLGVLRRAGLLELTNLVPMLLAWREVRQRGPCAGALHVTVTRDGPDRVGLVDEWGALTFGDLDRRSNAVCRQWADRGLGTNSVVGVLCRNHRGLADALFAAGKLGARVVLMNTGFGGAQLTEVARRESLSALVYDEEFDALVEAIPQDVPRFLAVGPAGTDSFAEASAAYSTEPVAAPRRPAGVVLLTSGTTGTPKGAPRQSNSPMQIVSFLDRIPLRARESTYIAVPVFHATGLAHFLLAIALGSTVVTARRFDTQATLRSVHENRCTAAILVPTMLQRLLDINPAIRGKYPMDAMRVLFCAGDTLPPELSTSAMDVFGDVVYNMYGSTELAIATVATPADLRAAPGTVGRAPLGCQTRLYDEQGRQVTKPHAQGQVYAISAMSFGGYTDGGNKDVQDGFLASGDVGHVDSSGRLFIDGRVDDMIVSGGENVFPVEIENVLFAHEKIAEAAVIGVPDSEFGKRLRAFVVPSAGAEPTEEEVQAFVKERLARYKVPRDVLVLDELPRNASGKILRHTLQEL